MMRKVQNRKGFSLAEMMLVVAILVILMAVVGVLVARYQKRLHQLEMDGHAKEILVAAQNHLTTVKSQGYLGLKKFGTALDADKVRERYGIKTDDVYYFVVNGSASFNDSESLLSAMLPSGSVDDTLRTAGSFVIVYQKSSGTVLDVFYDKTSGRFGYTFGTDDMPAAADTDLKLLSYYGDDKKTARASYKGSKSVIGWHGDAAPVLPAGKMELNAPLLRVYNGETLFALVFPENDAANFYSNNKVKLDIAGVGSGNTKTLTYNSAPLMNYEDNITTNQEPELMGKPCYYVVLDDITQYDMHFKTQFGGADGLIPGEDIRLTAKVTSNDGAETLSSPTYRTNSLFAYNPDDDTSSEKVAKVGWIRHLENLDQAVSGFTTSGTNWSYVATSGENKDKVQAVQVADLSWDWHGSNNKTIFYASSSSTPSPAAAVGTYHPVNSAYPLAYDGDGHSISNVVVSAAGGDGGMFGTLDNDSVRNLQLVDFSVSGDNAGALAGEMIGSGAENVVAYHSSGKETNKITSSAANGNAGGLIGYAQNATVTRCAAALCVEANTDSGIAGGLIGKAKDTTVSSSYSGGHTKDGQYYDKTSDTYIYSIKGATAGGLVGAAQNSAVSYSYSTCSAQGTAAAGGFVGSAAGDEIGNCYATGRVSGTTLLGAFAGQLSGTNVSDSHYYMIVNETATNEGAVYSAPVGAKVDAATAVITALDDNPAAYDAFVGTPDDWRNAKPYDSTLYTYYAGSYCLGTRGQLGLSASDDSFVVNHYGDWPAPETWVINK